jgi:hypothetical protein
MKPDSERRIAAVGDGDERLFDGFAALQRGFDQVENGAGAFRPAERQGQEKM